MKRTYINALVLGTLCAATSAASAALVFQSDLTSYSVDSSGQKQAVVNIYLAQTGATTTLTSEGGLNSVGFVVTPSNSLTAPTLLSITPNSTFTGTKTGNTTAGTLYEEMTDITSGVTASSNRVFLGTFTYSGLATTASTTTFTIADRAARDDTYTASGTLLDSQLASGTFTITVPEPASLAVMAFGGLLMLHRRKVQR
jgi:hypothetical protein